MKKLLIISMVVGLTITTMFSSCSKDEEEKPTTGHIEGVIYDLETAVVLSDVRIIVFDANTNAPINETHLSNSEGYFKIELDPGTYYLKLYKLGYESIPRPGMSAIPLSVNVGEITIIDFELTESSVTNGGVISGNVKFDGNGLGGVLVVAQNANEAYSSVSDAAGDYYIYNVPPGNYEVVGLNSGFNSSMQNATVEASTELKDINLDLTQDALATVSGLISFLSTGNIEVDVSLVHPITKETIPGLVTRTIGGNYSIQNVPDGTYLGRASYENDLNVLDPDWIVKNGEPIITVSGGDISLNFSVTSAVSLISPSNDSSSVLPVDVNLDTLQFSWMPYPSSSDYVIEVMDANGSIIWGGFTNDWSQKNIIIPNTDTSVLYNFDGSAKGELEVGRIYRWRIYASKDDKQSATGWRLVSVSEDQIGLIKIVE